jgi:hypothetical protein
MADLLKRGKFPVLGGDEKVRFKTDSLQSTIWEVMR